MSATDFPRASVSVQPSSRPAPVFQLVILPSVLLSGFMFPFRGMPSWAQFIGELLPLTHFLRVVRGILLKGNGLAEVFPDLWPISVFAVIALILGVKRYRQTLD